ncbi:hypothetical protein FRC09_004398 [Ceratobasidium sp. 395]|nr:hypothetical protein FRC09_004398 [Ceratobasidium sp. 395]
MLTRASTIPSVTLSEENSVLGSMLSSAFTSLPSLSVPAISEDLLQTPGRSIPKPAGAPVSLHIPISSSLSSTATPELTPPSSRSSPSAELAGLTPSPSVQPEVLPDVTIKSSSPALTKSPSITAATKSSTPICQHVPAKRETAKPDGKGSMGIEDLRNLLKDLLKQQDVVAGRQDDHTALLKELCNRPPTTVVYQAPEVSELSEHRIALTKIEHILGNLVDRFDVVRDTISSSSLNRSSTLTSSSETISSSTTSRPTYRSSEDERFLHDKWNQVARRPAISIPPRGTSSLLTLGGGPPSEVFESEAGVHPPTAAMVLPHILTLRPRPHCRRTQSASPTLTLERLIESVASLITSSEKFKQTFEIPPFRGVEKVAPTPAAPVAPAPPAPEEPWTPSTTKPVEDVDTDVECTIHEMRKRRTGGGDGAYIPSILQPPAGVILPPALHPEREDDVTPRPSLGSSPSAPSDLGQGPCQHSPTSEYWYECPRSPPTADERTEVELSDREEQPKSQPDTALKAQRQTSTMATVAQANRSLPGSDFATLLGTGRGVLNTLGPPTGRVDRDLIDLPGDTPDAPALTARHILAMNASYIVGHDPINVSGGNEVART